MSRPDVPYIGSKISLISKSEIRYEGRLYTIDAKESTVALQNVRSFGTEGRRGGKNELEPSNEVYDYIIFRGSDIKDLHVSEAPVKPPASNPPPNDPAIINAMSSPQSQQQLPPMFPYQFPVPNYQHFPNYPYYMGYPPQPQQQPQSHQQQQATSLPVQPAKPQEAPQPPKATNLQPTQQPSTVPEKVMEEKQKPPVEHTKNHPEFEAKTEIVQEEKKKGTTFQQHRSRNSNQYDSSQNRTYNQQNQNYRPQRKFEKGRFYSNQKTLEEFDFESANTKFDKEKIYAEVATEKNEEIPSKAYDKSSSFFDSISCEATETKDKPSRQLMAEQRKIDSETFGSFSNRRGGYYNNRGGSYNNRRNYSNNRSNQTRPQTNKQVFKPVNQDNYRRNNPKTPVND